MCVNKAAMEHSPGYHFSWQLIHNKPLWGTTVCTRETNTWLCTPSGQHCLLNSLRLMMVLR
jgi:hypothetical protein